MIHTIKYLILSKLLGPNANTRDIRVFLLVVKNAELHQHM